MQSCFRQLSCCLFHPRLCRRLLHGEEKAMKRHNPGYVANFQQWVDAGGLKAWLKHKGEHICEQRFFWGGYIGVFAVGCKMTLWRLASVFHVFPIINRTILYPLADAYVCLCPAWCHAAKQADLAAVRINDHIRFVHGGKTEIVDRRA